MHFYADFHVHSKYSRATSAQLDLEHLYVAAQKKGLTVIGTGDFTHPAWFEEIKNKLEPAEEGLYALRPEIARACDQSIPSICRRPVRFMLVTEISNIYKKIDRTRKNHNLIFLPGIDDVTRFNKRLEKIGNITADGRPILGLDSRNLLEIVLETSPAGYLVPAHIWTPWFSLLGSKSGFDNVSECFADLTHHIFAVETGLSSDPLMNWQVSGLDGMALISNSDAHSPNKLGREANEFDAPLTYADICSALKAADSDQFLGTIEFYPQEGKYHFDGHRKCHFSCEPKHTRELEGLCPVCGRQMTLGVLYRVEMLADRQPGSRSPHAKAFHHLIPLQSLLAEILQAGPDSKKVSLAYDRLITRLGPEYDILHGQSKEELNAGGIPLLAEAVERMRAHQVHYQPGYDGEFGQVGIFSEEERIRLLGQRTLFSISMETPGKENQQKLQSNSAGRLLFAAEKARPQSVELLELNREQQAVVEHDNGPLLISAGPGTGKTHTITCRIASLIKDRAVSPDSILSVTFTQKAAQEMTHRLRHMIPAIHEFPLITTFHGFCWKLLKEDSRNQQTAIISESSRRIVMGDAMRQVCRTYPEDKEQSAGNLLEHIINAKQLLLRPQDDLGAIVPADRQSFVKALYQAYQNILAVENLFDFEDLIFVAVQRLRADKYWRTHIQNRFKYIFIDEFQDINFSQYQLIAELTCPSVDLCAIGDPDQAIYGFRGSDWRYFQQFSNDHKDTTHIFLNRNYRSCETILEASYQIIRHHPFVLNHDRRVFSEITGIDSIPVFEAASVRAEAVFIGKTIEDMMGGIGFYSIDFGKTANDHSHERSFSDFAVLFRTHAQGEFLEKTLTSAGIPCQSTDHRSFQEKPGISKISAVLRLMADRSCYADLHQVLDMIVPPLPKKALQAFKDWAYAQKIPLRKGILKVEQFPIPGLSAADQHRLVSLMQFLQRLIDDAENLSVVERIELIISRTLSVDAAGKDDDLRAMLLQAQPFEHQLEYFLACQATQSDTDLFSNQAEKVALLTMHAAKGLEFPIVFIAGCEDGLIPFQFPASAISDTEEERRLFFVAMTRAREQLILSWARKRHVFGQILFQRVSPFLQDIQRKKIETNPDRPFRHRQLSLF